MDSEARASDAGRKDDSGKVRYELISPIGLHELAKTYTVGAEKYGDHNWVKGLHYCRLFGAIMRHLWAWFRGESWDPDNGQHHLAAAAFGCLTLIHYEMTGIGHDDRWSCDKERGGGT